MRRVWPPSQYSARSRGTRERSREWWHRTRPRGEAGEGPGRAQRCERCVADHAAGEQPLTPPRPEHRLPPPVKLQQLVPRLFALEDQTPLRDPPGRGRGGGRVSGGRAPPRARAGRARGRRSRGRTKRRARGPGASAPAGRAWRQRYSGGPWSGTRSSGLGRGEGRTGPARQRSLTLSDLPLGVQPRSRRETWRTTGRTSLRPPTRAVLAG